MIGQKNCAVVFRQMYGEFCDIHGYIKRHLLKTKRIVGMHTGNILGILLEFAGKLDISSFNRFTLINILFSNTRSHLR